MVGGCGAGERVYMTEVPRTQGSVESGPGGFWRIWVSTHYRAPSFPLAQTAAPTSHHGIIQAVSRCLGLRTRKEERGCNGRAPPSMKIPLLAASSMKQLVWASGVSLPRGLQADRSAPCFAQGGWGCAPSILRAFKSRSLPHPHPATPPAPSLTPKRTPGSLTLTHLRRLPSGGALLAR